MAYFKNPQLSDEDKTSRINAAGIINITLENLWRDAYVALSRGDYTLWNRKLDAVWLILGGDVKKSSNEEKKFNAMELKIYETGSLSNKKVGFESTKPDESSKRAIQYRLLMEKSLFLRRLQNSQGKGTAYISEDEDDFD